MTMALIIDLDDTLADTSQLAPLRQARRWKDCVRKFSLSVRFALVAETLQELRHAGVKVGVVTASVSFYAEGLLRHLEVPYDALVAYHDCSPRKPHPAPITMCMNRLGATAGSTLGVGDALIDCDAYHAAGIPAWGAGWSQHLDQTASWDEVPSTPARLLTFFGI